MITTTPVETSSLADALAYVQTRLPVIGKGGTAKVKTKDGGSYSYSYADLATVSKAILPLLGAVGLAFTSKPTLREDGRFVLAYRLLHKSGESEDGEYPLPAQGSPQEIGSAITYARRYTLLSVTGAAPESDDDDGVAATRRHTEPDPWGNAQPSSAAVVAAIELRDRALNPEADFTAIQAFYRDAMQRELLVVLVANETGDQEELGKLLIRVGKERQ